MAQQHYRKFIIVENTDTNTYNVYDQNDWSKDKTDAQPKASDYASIDEAKDWVDSFYADSVDESMKPKCALIGEDSNIFNLMGLAAKCLRENGLDDQAIEMTTKIYEDSDDYNKCINIISDYVLITEDALHSPNLSVTYSDDMEALTVSFNNVDIDDEKSILKDIVDSLKDICSDIKLDDHNIVFTSDVPFETKEEVIQDIILFGENYFAEEDSPEKVEESIDTNWNDLSDADQTAADMALNLIEYQKLDIEDAVSQACTIVGDANEELDSEGYEEPNYNTVLAYIQSRMTLNEISEETNPGAIPSIPGKHKTCCNCDDELELKDDSKKSSLNHKSEGAEGKREPGVQYAIYDENDKVIALRSTRVEAEYFISQNDFHTHKYDSLGYERVKKGCVKIGDYISDLDYGCFVESLKLRTPKNHNNKLKEDAWEDGPCGGGYGMYYDDEVGCYYSDDYLDNMTASDWHDELVLRGMEDDYDEWEDEDLFESSQSIFSDSWLDYPDDATADAEWCNIYGGDPSYCRKCGNPLEYDEDGAYCPYCNPRDNAEFMDENLQLRTESLLQDLHYDYELIRSTYGQEVYDALNDFVNTNTKYTLGDVLYSRSAWKAFEEYCEENGVIIATSTLSESKSLNEMTDDELDAAKRDIKDHSSPEAQKLSCIDMINSILAYYPGDFHDPAEIDNILNDEYLQKYIETLGKDTVVNLIKDQINDIDGIDQNVATDSDGLSYNSIRWKKRKHTNGNLADFDPADLMNKVQTSGQSLHTLREYGDNIYMISIFYEEWFGEPGINNPDELYWVDVVVRYPDGSDDRIVLKSHLTAPQIIDTLNSWKASIV